MSNEITPRTIGTALSTDLASRLLSGIAESRASAPLLGGGKPLLRMLKSGEWVYGQTNDEVQGGSRWALNIVTLAHGWCCWVDGGEKEKNSLAGEIMASVTEPRPAQPPDIGKFPYKDQRSFDLRCLDGADEGVEVTHKVTSIGGLRAVDGLLAAIHTQLRQDPAHPCPVIVFGHDHYQHQKYGKTFIPIYRIVDWCDLDGNLASNPSPAAIGKAAIDALARANAKPSAIPDPEPVETPAVKLDRPVKPALRPNPAPKPAPPVATAQLHTGQRRRPVAR